MYKFVLVEKLFEDATSLNRLQRVYETFDHIISIREDRIHRVYESCKKYDINCEIIDDIKYIYENPLIKIYENSKENNETPNSSQKLN